MKILYCDWGSNSNQDICKSFQKLGIHYEVFQCSIINYEDDRNLLESLSRVLRRECFNAIFSFDYIPVVAYAAKECRTLYYAWVYDCPHSTLFSESVNSEYNRIFLFDRQQCDYFRKRGVKNVWHMPLAVNTDKYNDLLGTDIKNTEYIHDISFIGNLYNDNLYNQINYLPDYLKGYLNAILQSQKSIYGYDLISELLTDEIINELN